MGIKPKMRGSALTFAARPLSTTTRAAKSVLIPAIDLIYIMEPILVTLIGSTGLTGSSTLQSLLASPAQPFHITTLTRSAPNASEPANPATEHTNHTFSDLFEATRTQIASSGSVFVSCLGTTKAAAGGIENQRKIDLDLNRDLAQKAKSDGAVTVS